MKIDLHTAPEAPQDLFVEEDLYNYQHASTGQRFLNYLIDGVVVQYGLAFLVMMLFAWVLSVAAPDTAYELFSDENNISLLMVSYTIIFINYLLYYTLCEAYCKGYTLGKLITGTRAIRLDGGNLKLKDALLRSLSRMVPFEPFSGFSDPWHDTWTKTAVVKTR